MLLSYPDCKKPGNYSLSVPYMVTSPGQFRGDQSNPIIQTHDQKSKETGTVPTAGSWEPITQSHKPRQILLCMQNGVGGHVGAFTLLCSQGRLLELSSVILEQVLEAAWV